MSSEDASESSNRDSDAEHRQPNWIGVQRHHFEGVDIEAPLAGCSAADCRELSKLYSDAAGELSDLLAAKPYAVLAAVTGFHFKPHEPTDPFGPMMVTSEGRTAAPQDFIGDASEAIYSILPRLSHPSLRARIADLSWCLDRSRADAASAAILAYVRVVELVRDGSLEFSSSEDRELGYRCLGGLRRALTIARAVGWDKAEAVKARNLLLELRQKAVAKKKLRGIRDVCEIDLNFGVSAPEDIARCVESTLSHPDLVDPNLRNFHWKLAAQGFHRAKLTEKANRCRMAAAECLVELAERSGVPAMFAAHWMQAAIAEMHGVAGARERKAELRHRLIDIQMHIPDEMSPFTHETDISEIIEQTEERLRDTTLTQKLGVFACLTSSPSMEALRDAATESIAKFPLSALFAPTHVDVEGKTVRRAFGTGELGAPSDDVIESQIAQHEKIRRDLVVAGEIEVARRSITLSHFLTERHFFIICLNSPFVPANRRATFAKGLLNFFQGDAHGALYILVPQLENSLRHVLKMHGHDVTKSNSKDDTQEDRTISSLYEHMREEMESIFGAALVADIDRVFLRKSGPYIRHKVAHGLLGDFEPHSADAIYGCWLIYRLCCLPLLPNWDQVEAVHLQVIGQ